MASLSWSESQRVALMGHLGGFISGFMSVWIVGLPNHLCDCEQASTIHQKLILAVLVFTLWATFISAPFLPAAPTIYRFAQTITPWLTSALGW